jgi:hypothetical protein
MSSSSSPAASAARKDTEQRTLFSVGVSKTFHKGKDAFTITSSDKSLAAAPPSKYPCRFCSRVFNHASARTLHERTHAEQKGSRVQKSKLDVLDSNRLPVAVRQCVNDIIRRSIFLPHCKLAQNPPKNSGPSSCPTANFLPFHDDERAEKEKAAKRDLRGKDVFRQGRTLFFKKRVIMHYEETLRVLGTRYSSKTVQFLAYTSGYLVTPPSFSGSVQFVAEIQHLPA